MQDSLSIKKVGVLGAGVMGAQIAAHCANAGFEVYLFDLAADAPKKTNTLVEQAVMHLKKIKPSPLGDDKVLANIHPKNYSTHLDSLNECELVIEAVAERLDIKTKLYQMIGPCLKKDVILASNTSGLFISTLAKLLPEVLQARFLGVHFFNPPRYMHLVELIAQPKTQAELVDKLEAWLVRYLGKGVVRAKDTPNFIANRVGVFSLLATLHYAQKHRISPETVDALTGPALGRPKSATYRTMDVVGLDTMAHVVDTMQRELKEDPWHAWFKLSPELELLIQQGKFGAKSGAGVYRKQGKMIEVFDAAIGTYRAQKLDLPKEIQAFVAERDNTKKLAVLLEGKSPEALFLKEYLASLFRYCAVHQAEISHSVRDIDNAMRWGFAWDKGPFELWESMGLEQVQTLLDNAKSDIHCTLPAMPKQGFYTKNSGAYSFARKEYEAKSNLSVYQRQAPSLKPAALSEKSLLNVQMDSRDVAVIQWLTKSNTLTLAMLLELAEYLDKAQREISGVVLYQNNPSLFSAGANLVEMRTAIERGAWNDIDTMLARFQSVQRFMKQLPFPVVAALRGKALGGGAELVFACDGVVAAFESYIGLVEVGPGLIPAGGGTTELARRSGLFADKHERARKMLSYFRQMATAAVSQSALQARDMGYLRDCDDIVMHSEEVLYAALAKVHYLNDSNYVALPEQAIVATGAEGYALIQAELANYSAGGFIGDYDKAILEKLGQVLTVSEVTQGTLVPQDYMHKREREAFVELAQDARIVARIDALLSR